MIYGCICNTAPDSPFDTPMSARLKVENAFLQNTVCEDGNWHRMLFTVKKWDESGNVTHVCKIREELRRFCIKMKLGKRHVKYDDEK